MSENEVVWLEFIKVSTQILMRLKAEGSEPLLDSEHIKRDLQEFKELDNHIEEAGKIVEEMVQEDKDTLAKGK
jgi:hypothetical protein